MLPKCENSYYNKLFHVYFSKKLKTFLFFPKKTFLKKTVCFLCFYTLNSYAVSLIPDEMHIPTKLKLRSSVQIEAVFSSLEKQHNKKTANLWKLKYQKALLLKKKEEQTFCKIMKELAETPLFPLKDLALIKTYEWCPFSVELKFEPVQFTYWLRLPLAEAFYKRRKKFKDLDQTLQVTKYLAQNSLYKESRISYLKHALALAKEQKKTTDVKNLQEFLYQEAPRLKPNPEEKDYFSIAKDSRQNRKFKKAIVFYIKVLNSSRSTFQEKNKSFKGLNRIYRIQRAKKQRIINTKQWLTWLLQENTEQSLIEYYKRELELARQQWNLNENQKAIDLITEILQKSNSKPIHVEALYLRSLIYIQEKQPQLSLKDWEQALKLLKRNKGNLYGKILWSRAWLLRSQKKYRLAMKDLSLLERKTQNPYLKYKVLFWKGKTFQDLGQSTLAKRSFNKLIEQDYFGYYGLLARKFSNKKPDFEIQEQTLESLAFSVDKKDENLLHWLLLFEEGELLSHFLDTRKSEFFGQTHKTKQEWLKILLLYTKAKKYLDVFKLLTEMDIQTKQIFFHKYNHILFPIAFSKDTKEASDKWNIPLALIFSIIRQESAFNIRARSSADAFGLMQLIPSTAKQMARKFKIPYRNFRDLYRPRKNIFLGTVYLKELLASYNNNFLFSVASYNAGGTSVKKWIKYSKSQETLDFIENIPYEETRTYVRLVIRNYIFYHNQLNPKTEEWFPDWLIQ